MSQTILIIIETISLHFSLKIRNFLILMVNNRQQIIELHHIDKWYHVGLACQILNVCGIPVELEKLVVLLS